ncbi:MAG: zinc ribbon domain-containing protein, partial [Opitutaceae bacterium]|nr:zinc ribbon domain-containing protein [Opitutaceae bacterium]
MATYVYETVPTDPTKPRRRFEVKQSMKDAPLTADPETGEPVQRVITGGYGLMGVSRPESGAPGHSHAHAHSHGGGGGCCGGACGCGH